MTTKTTMKTVAVFCWFMAFVPMLFVPENCLDTSQLASPPMLEKSLMDVE